jgi:phage terminase large subunit-like protein
MIEAGWPYTNIRAISNGAALAPSLHSIEALQEKRRILGAYGFGAMYLGEPRPPEGTIFRGVKCYTERPFGKPAVGCDLAYTAKTSADWSVAVELLRTTWTDNGLPVYAVMRVRRAQCEAPDFLAELRAASDAWAGAPIRWRASGPESGAAQFFRRAGLNMSVVRPPGDKLTSAMAAAAAWNDGRILVPDVAHFPECEPWLTPFLKCVHGFTGSNREQDDDVDALGSALSLLDAPAGRYSALKDRLGGMHLRLA